MSNTSKKLPNGAYINVQSFMINDLGLSGNELLIYAVIHGFSQDGRSWFTGSREYLSSWISSTPKTVTTNLQKLQKRGLIQKRMYVEHGRTFNAYRTRPLQLSTQNPEGKNYPPRGKELPSVGVKITSNNIVDNNISTTTIRARFIPPTLEEVTAYIREKGYNINPERFIAYYESNGWKVGRNPMKSWKAALTTWATSSGNAKSTKEVPKRDFSEYV